MAECKSCSGGARMHKDIPLTEQPALTQYGIYDLITSASIEAYTGRFRHTNVRIVGFRTPFEKIFKGIDNKAAIEYAKTANPEGQLRMFRAAATEIGMDVGLELFGV